MSEHIPDIKYTTLPIGDVFDRLTNYNQHPPEQIAEIERSIEKFKMVDPIIIGKESIIIAGHARLQACKNLGMETVPVAICGHLGPEDEEELQITLNTLQRWSFPDTDMLKSSILKLQELRGEDEPSIIGLDEDQMSAILRSADWQRPTPVDPNKDRPPRTGGAGDYGAHIHIQCPQDMHQEIMDLIQEALMDVEGVLVT